jgi:hypothetical protein
MRFELDSDQIAKYEAWTLKQDKVAVVKQKAEIKKTDAFYDTYKMCWDAGHPYYGAISGADEFIFIPTSIGTVVKVRNSYTENEIELTDYSSW